MAIGPRRVSFVTSSEKVIHTMNQQRQNPYPYASSFKRSSNNIRTLIHFLVARLCRQHRQFTVQSFGHIDGKPNRRFFIGCLQFAH
ncbi:hypothetical protein QUA47_29195 [Microcoleus sp. MON2_D5]